MQAAILSVSAKKNNFRLVSKQEVRDFVVFQRLQHCTWFESCEKSFFAALTKRSGATSSRGGECFCLFILEYFKMQFKTSQTYCRLNTTSAQRTISKVGMLYVDNRTCLSSAWQLYHLNRPFPNSCLPPLQRESECEVFLVKISFHSYVK